jgi:hypothetical protein
MSGFSVKERVWKHLIREKLLAEPEEKAAAHL